MAAKAQAMREKVACTALALPFGCRMPPTQQGDGEEKVEQEEQQPAFTPVGPAEVHHDAAQQWMPGLLDPSGSAAVQDDDRPSLHGLALLRVPDLFELAVKVLQPPPDMEGGEWHPDGR